VYLCGDRIRVLLDVVNETAFGERVTDYLLGGSNIE